MNTERRKPSLVHLFFYGLPSIALSFPLIPFAVFLPEYYAEDLGLGFLSVGIALFISRLFDVVSDPVAGFVSDKFSLFGSHRKIWMFLGGLVAGFALYQLATASAGVSVEYLGLWSAILYIGWTFVMVPYLALGADIADGYDAKTAFVSVREVFSLIGMLTALSLPLIIEGPILQSIPYYILPFGFVSLLCLIVFVPEAAQTDLKANENAIQFSVFKDVINQPLMKKILSIWFLTSTASAIPSVLFPVYVSSVLEGTENEQNLSIFIYFAAAVAGMPFWNLIAKGSFKHQIMAVSITIVCLGFPVAAFLPSGAVYAFYIVCIITGFALAAELVLAPSILADLTHLSRIQTGYDRTGIHFACWGVVSKLALAFAVLFAFGFLELAEIIFENSAYAFAVAILYAGLPVIFKIPTILLLKRFPFTDAERDLINEN
ncbi:MFS transporter [Kordiimonas sp. SCSIO 12610]|uniref:MFS transporter n=1 Tax=Kordiimonas sp. SCSIO 12610 TaxID=2829597 RepID=UPI00210C0018|nr:MFS transporter [Kordiimonas sp. SCSIO 12610]UTW54355.1 MFS transporter [Kordiimonas sp. SCSIO 12610]